MSAPTITQIQTAIHAWVRTTTNLPASSVIWRLQDGPRPARPYATLRLLEFQDIGTGWTERIDNSVPIPEQEIIYQARGQDRVRISIEVVTDVVVGQVSAPALLRAVRGSYKLPNIRALLVAAEVGVSSFGPITSLDFLENKTQQLSRAVMDAIAYVPTEFVQAGTFIETEDHTILTL